MPIMSGEKRLRDGKHLLKIYRKDSNLAPVFKPVQEAPSHWEGKWYQRPKRYPVAYFDADGYAVFQTGMELRQQGAVEVDVHFDSLRKLPTWRSLTPPPKQFER